jgi:IS30 family transposase
MTEVLVRTFGLTAEQQDEVWERWEAGASLRAVARQMGINRPATVRCFVASTGGVRRPARRRDARHLTAAEREEISRGVAAGESCRALARRLGRAPSTISRELARNGGRRRYRARTADAAADRRAERPKRCKLSQNERLRAEVERGLRRRWSPQQIAARLVVDHPDDEAMRVSHETIYLTLFVQARGALRRELTRSLRSGRAMRFPRGKRVPQGRGQLSDTVPVSERLAEAEDRAVPGHWEGDLIFGKRPSAIATLVERQTRYLQLVALPDGSKAEQVRPALAASIQRLPEELRRSLAWDHGKEMAEQLAFRVDTGVQVYFCDPHSPWQRGSNENTNGLVRQYLPRKTDLSRLSQAELNAIANELNTRPRQKLNWKTPSEALEEALR